MQTTVAAFAASFLHSRGFRHSFIVTGGGAMFLDDAFGNHPGIQPIYCHHEQSCSMAAESYARINGQPGLAIVTTGPGGINALNGVFGAWTDSIPMLILSGQVKRETCLSNYEIRGLRQLGDQEADIIAMVRPITKHASQITNPADIRRHLEEALHWATTGRPGPVWLDIPVDVQSALIDPDSLTGFDPQATGSASGLPPEELAKCCESITARIAQARRPVIMAGSGIRIGKALPGFHAMIERLGIPVVTAWTHDLVSSDHPLLCGRPGTIGTRAGNFVVQNADLLLVLGSRLNIRQTSYNFAAFAPRAFKIQVDIDPAELNKPTVRIDQGVHCALSDFFSAMNTCLDKHPPSPFQFADWLSTCRNWQQRYPAVQERQRLWAGKINIYAFIEILGELLAPDDIVVCGNASACIVPFQVLKIKAGQRMFSNSGCASMGYDLPAAIGACYGATLAAGKPRRIICLAGDGSIMMNLQELQTIARYRLPIKIVVLDNEGYLSIRTSQDNFFNRRSGADPKSGVSFPDFAAVATAFGIPSRRIDQADYQTDLQSALETDGPELLHVILDPEQQFEPRMSSRQLENGQIVSAALEDMYPFLDREELAQNMLDS